MTVARLNMAIPHTLVPYQGTTPGQASVFTNAAVPHYSEVLQFSGIEPSSTSAAKPQRVTLKEVWTHKIKDAPKENSPAGWAEGNKHFLLGSEKTWWQPDSQLGQNDNFRYRMFTNYSDKKLNLMQRFASRMLWSYQALTRKSHSKFAQGISSGCAYPHYHRLSCSEHALVRIQTKGHTVGGFIQSLAEIWRYNMNCPVTGISKKVRFDAIGAKAYIKHLTPVTSAANDGPQSKTLNVAA